MKNKASLKWLSVLLALVMALGCGVTAFAAEGETSLDKIDMTAWQYNADDDVYYQVGISYCAAPANESYETLAIFVPGAYFDAVDNGDGTYTCTVNDTAEVAGYSASTAPIVFPVETPGYSAQSALTGYANVSVYTDAGFVYFWAGCRGRNEGAPAGVTDLKAAVRYIRYNEGLIPGAMDRIFSFGMSGGGAQSALMGATGDSELYTPYLEAIGAVMETSDAVNGSMCWCPITNLDTANEAYEWNMGVTRTDLSDEAQALSDAMAEAFAAYVNDAGFVDEDGNVLTLEESGEGVYQAGSYYDYIKGVVEESLNNFLADTEFPYTAGGSGGFGGRGGNRGGSGEMNYEEEDNIWRSASISAAVTLSGTYETAQDYIDALNEPFEWVTYDAETNTASITSVADFAVALKPASKSLLAFDAFGENQGENVLFGDGDGAGDHFDAITGELLEGTEYEGAWAEDLARVDEQGSTVEDRVEMYTPLYYLLESYDGYGTSTVATWWRIRSGINQGDTSVTTETNLALALEAYDGVESVDYATVWGLGHTKAERSGDSTANFIAWVNECLGE